MDGQLGARGAHGDVAGWRSATVHATVAPCRHCPCWAGNGTCLGPQCAGPLYSPARAQGVCYVCFLERSAQTSTDSPPSTLPPRFAHAYASMLISFPYTRT